MPEVRSLLELSQGLFRRTFSNLAEESQFEGVPAPNPDNSGGTPTGPSGGTPTGPSGGNNSGSDYVKDPNEGDFGGGRNDYGGGSYVPGSGVHAGSDRLNSGTDDGQTPEADPVGGIKYGGGGPPIDTRSDLEILVDKFANGFFGDTLAILKLLIDTVGNQIFEDVLRIIQNFSNSKHLPGNKTKPQDLNTLRGQIIGFLRNLLNNKKNMIIDKLKNNESISFGFGAVGNPKNFTTDHGVGDPKFSSHQINFIPMSYRDNSGNIRHYIKVTITDKNGRILNEIDFK